MATIVARGQNRQSLLARELSRPCFVALGDSPGLLGNEISVLGKRAAILPPPGGRGWQRSGPWKTAVGMTVEGHQDG